MKTEEGVKEKESALREARKVMTKMAENSG